MIAKRRALEIDFLARRYGKLPSEILSLDIDEFAFNQVIAGIAVEESTKGK